MRGAQAEVRVPPPSLHSNCAARPYNLLISVPIPVVTVIGVRCSARPNGAGVYLGPYIYCIYIYNKEKISTKVYKDDAHRRISDSYMTLVSARLSCNSTFVVSNSSPSKRFSSLSAYMRLHQSTFVHYSLSNLAQAIVPTIHPTHSNGGYSIHNWVVWLRDL